MKTLCIIPMRSGSKGIPGKNMTAFAGQSLCRWTIDQAIASGAADRIIVSTDADDYRQRIDLWYPGANLIPYLRPKNLAKDNSKTSDVILHVLEREPGYDTILLLEPTSPLRLPGDIGTALATLRDREDAQAIVSVCDDHRAHPALSYRLSRAEFLEPGVDTPHFRRQQLDPFFHPTGTLYAARVDWYREHQTFLSHETIGYKVNKWQDYEIDEPHDLILVEALFRKYVMGAA